MIQLEERARRASLARRARERALLAVAREDLASHRPGDVTRLRRAHRALRTRRLSQPLLLELVEQRVERAVDHHREVAARIAMAHQIPRTLELLPQLLARHEVQRDAPDPLDTVDASGTVDAVRPHASVSGGVMRSRSGPPASGVDDVRATSCWISRTLSPAVAAISSSTFDSLR